MCLLTKHSEPLTAGNDITCYKILVKINKNEFITPYKYSVINDTKKTFVASGDDKATFFFTMNDVTYYEVNGGFIHTYSSINDAIYVRHIIEEEQVNRAKAVIFKCVIPKGTDYYPGMHGTIFGYAAKQINFINQVR